LSIPIYVDGYSGYRLNERPSGFEIDDVYYRIYAVEDQWYSPGAQFFKVRADGKRFIFRYDQEHHEWTLQSAYDGAELFARCDVQVITVDPAVVRTAEKLIESCEQCHPEDAEWPFAWVLDQVTGHGGDRTDYLMTEPARCPNCRREVTEHMLVERRPQEE